MVSEQATPYIWRFIQCAKERSGIKRTVLTKHAFNTFDQDNYLLVWIEAFLTDRKSRGLAAGTLLFYSQKLRLFTDFCEGQEVTQISQVDANLLRRLLIWLEETGHNPGGVHG